MIVLIWESDNGVSVQYLARAASKHQSKKKV